MIWEIDDATRTIEGLDAHGRPMPGYAASLGLLPARPGQRVLATLCEAAIALILLLPLLIVALPVLVGAALDPEPQQVLATRSDLIIVLICAAASWFLSIAFIIVQLVLHGRRGVTVGKAIAGIRSVNVRTLERPGFWRGAVVRYLVLAASMIVPLIGPVLVIAVSPLIDPERRGRGWADLAGATWFVDVRRGLNPYDGKRMRIARKTVTTPLRDVVTRLPSLATPADPVVGAAAFPVARSTGGVLGAPRTQASGAAAPPAAASAAAQSRPPVTPAAPTPPSPAPTSPAPTHPAPTSPAPTSPAPTSPAPTNAVDAAPSISPPARDAAPAAAWAPPSLLPEPPATTGQAGAPSAPAAAAPAPSAAASPAPATPAAPASPAVPAAGTATLVLETGERIAVAGDGVLLGRAPARARGDAELLPVPIADTTKSVSKTHVAVHRIDGVWAAEDLHSTNGSAIVRDGTQHELLPGRPLPLRDGDELRFGDRRARFQTD